MIGMKIGRGASLVGFDITYPIRLHLQGLVGVVLLVAPALPIQAQLSIANVGTFSTTPPGMNTGLSGLCYFGGTQYYAGDDSGGVM